MLLKNISCKYGKLGGIIYKKIVHLLLVSHEKKDESSKILLHIYWKNLCAYYTCHMKK